MKRSLLPAVGCAVLAAALSAPALAQSRGDAEAACQDQARRRGHTNVRFDDTRFDRSRNGVTLTGRMRAGKDDEFRFECRLDGRGRVSGWSLNRAGGRDVDDRRGDRDRDRGRDRDRDRDNDSARSRYRSLIGADGATLDREMRAMGFEPAEQRDRRSRDWNYWWLGATGECLATRSAGGRVNDIRRGSVDDCQRR